MFLAAKTQKQEQLVWPDDFGNLDKVGPEPFGTGRYWVQVQDGIHVRGGLA
jgi:hypothetical protein